MTTVTAPCRTAAGAGDGSNPAAAAAAATVTRRYSILEF